MTEIWKQSWPEDGLENVDRCPACGGADRDILHRGLRDLAFGCAPGEWTMWRCQTCATGYLDPRPDSAHIAKAYTSYYTHDDVTGAAQAEPDGAIRRIRRALANGYINRRYSSALKPSSMLGPAVIPLFQARKRQILQRYRHLPRSAPPHGRLLDLGCGNGEFMQRARAVGWQVEGVDPDGNAIAVARKAGLNVQQGGLELFAGQTATFDFITMSHVIEHLHDPAGTIMRCHQLLRPGGMLYVETPNIESAGHHRFGAFWRGLEAPRHLLVLSHAGLGTLLGAAGFAEYRQLALPDVSNQLAWESEQMARKAGPAKDQSASMQPSPPRDPPPQMAAEFIGIIAKK